MTTKLYGGDKRLYTAAEARRIDKEASKDADRGGRITRGNPFERPIHFDEEALVWGCQLINDFFPIFLDSEELLKEQWMPFTAFLNAEQSENPEPEQKPIVLDYLVLVEANERIKQLEKELAELTDKARWKSCKDEKPTGYFHHVAFKNQKQDRLFGLGTWHLERFIFYSSSGGEIDLSDKALEQISWKYEADL